MTSLAQRSMAGGELSPAMSARVDQVKYQTGLRTCRNFWVMRHGGVTNRPGTRFIAEQKSNSARGRMLKFIFNNEQTYVLVFEDRCIRFIREGAELNVSGVPAYNGATAYVPGDMVLSGAVNYYCKANSTGNAPPNVTYWYPLSGTIYEIPTPYVSADLPTLKYSQSGDVVTITHPNYPPYYLSRTGHTTWTLTAATFTPSITAPGSVVNSGPAGTTTQWVVTAVKDGNYEESLESTSTGTSATPSSGSPITVSWAAVSGAIEYNVYKKKNGVWGFIGTTTDAAFIDDGIVAVITDTPPVSRNPFATSNNYPSATTNYQQRQIYANTNNNPEGVWGTRSGSYKNLTVSSPSQADDAVTWSMAGRQVNAIKHMVEVGQLVMLTSGAEVVIQGNAGGVLAPGEVNPNTIAYNGASDVVPAVVGNSIVYVQARGTIIRDLKYEVQSTGYTGRDLTVFSSHLFDKYTVVAMDYAQIPHSIVYAVRDDGTLLGMTYMREQEVWGWHRHDTDGEFEDVCVIPEGNEDVAYFLVQRTVNGVTKRYKECFASRVIEDVARDAFFVDSGLSYDGTNTSATTMTLTGGTDWTIDETLILTASVAYFSSGDVGNAIVLTVDEVSLTLTISGYTSTTEVSVRPARTVAAAFRSVALTTWAKAVDQVGGMSHLEAKSVAILADANVQAQVVVTGGVVSLDRPYVHIHIGLPITADIETLSIDTTEAETLLDKLKLISHVGLITQETRGLWGGNNFDNMYEFKQRSFETYDDPIAPRTGIYEVGVDSNWDYNGRVAIRQIDPLPATILAVIPKAEASA